MSLNFGYIEVKPKASSSGGSVDTLALLAKSGGTMTGEIDMGDNKITNLGSSTDHTDASTKKYVDDLGDTKLDLAGGAMTGPLGLSGRRIWNMADPTLPTTGANRGYVDNEISRPNIIDTAYTLVAHNDNVSVNGSSVQTRVNNALSASELTETRKIIELNFSHNQSYGNSFFFNNNGMALFGRLDNLSGHIKEVEITIVQPGGRIAAQRLSSVQMLMCNQSNPTSMTANLTQKLTRALTSGTYELTPLTTRFTGLRYIGFFFTEGDAITRIEFRARIVLCVQV